MVVCLLLEAISPSKGGCRVTQDHFHNSAVRILSDRAARIEQQHVSAKAAKPRSSPPLLGRSLSLSLSLSLLLPLLPLLLLLFFLFPSARLFDTYPYTHAISPSLFRISTPPSLLVALTHSSNSRSIAGSILFLFSLLSPALPSLAVVVFTELEREREEWKERNKGGEKPGPVWRQCLR